jgi:drug/metabolite transporter (DMT)-like permease
MTSVLLTVQPVGSVALAALILGESPSALQLLGVLLVLTALLIAARREPALAGGQRVQRPFARKRAARTASEPARP